jgi:lysophospholipase L1-like esterase
MAAFLFRHRSPFLVVLIAAIVAFLGLELFSRFWLGLGDPPLMLVDPSCGYRFAPSQNVWRFGNLVSFDSHSTRGTGTARPPHPRHTVLVIGDSVVNGGGLTADADTACGVLNSLAIRGDGGQLYFCNLSAGSWAPPQQLGYLKAYGTLGANVIVLVLSSHDALGPPEGTKAPFPIHKPWLAAEELLTRYVMRRESHFFEPSIGWKASAAEIPKAILESDDPTAASSWCLTEIVRLAETRAIPLAAVLWPTRTEAVQAAWEPIVSKLTDVLSFHAVPIVDLLSAIRNQDAFELRLYRDYIHPSNDGQRILAGGILQATGVVTQKQRTTGLER